MHIFDFRIVIYYEEVMMCLQTLLERLRMGTQISVNKLLLKIMMLFISTDRGKPRAFLYTIAKNLCINCNKKRKPDYLEATKEIIDITATEKINNITDKIILELIVNRLPQEQQEVIVLRYVHDLKVNEIAVITGKSRFSVRYRINSALSTIKNKLNGSDYIEKTIRK